MTFTLPDIPTEDRLLRRANLKDQAAITEIYERYFAPVYQYIRLHVEDAQLAEDIASEVFFKFVDTVGSHNGPRHSLRGWFFQVARNEIYQHYGKARKFPTMELDEQLASQTDSDLEVQMIRSMESEHARRALRMLTSEQREVLILRFLEELGLQETADMMGKSISAVKSLQFRAINLLRNILAEMKAESYG